MAPEREPIEQEPFIGAHEAAKVLGLKNFRTVYKWCKEGKIPRAFQYDIGGTLKFLESEIRTLAKRRQSAGDKTKTPPEGYELIEPNGVYTHDGLAKTLQVSKEGIKSYVLNGGLRFLPTPSGTMQFLGKHVLEFLDGIAQSIIPQGDSLAGATAMSAKPTKKRESDDDSEQ